MSSQPPAKPTSRGWGSLLSGAVAGLESRLDTILAEDDQASARARAAEKEKKEQLALEAARQKAAGVSAASTPGDGLSRNSSRSRANGRLQDRLAKAVVKGPDGQRAGSRPSSGAASPALPADAPRVSTDSKKSDISTEPTLSKSVGGEETAAGDGQATQGVEGQLGSPEPPKIGLDSITTSPRPSQESSRPSFDTLPQPAVSGEGPTLTRTNSSLDAELAKLQQTHADRTREQQDELHEHLERIDALQSKLTYLTKGASAAAREAAEAAASGTVERKLAEKDEQIAQLMEEGQKLSKNELKHLTVIKKLRTQRAEDEKAIADLKRRMAKVEASMLEAVERAKRAEAAEESANKKLSILEQIEKDVDALKREKETAALTISELRRLLEESTRRAEEAEKKAQTDALEAERRRVKELQDEIADAKIERKLVEDRAKAEARDIKEEAARQQERAKMTEAELKSEITNLETKLEVLRSRTEEVSSSGSGDSHAELLRRVETLQTQYVVASENWHGIESALTSRVLALEKERDESSKREIDIRRKAREVNSKARRLEDELEAVQERARNLEQDAQEQKETAQRLKQRLAQAETALTDARTEFDRDKKIWESELQQKIEEEKIKWRLEANNNSQTEPHFLRAESPFSIRKPSGSEIQSRRSMNRALQGELSLPPLSTNRPSSDRRASSFQHLARGGTPDTGTPHRQDSLPSSLSATHANGATPSASQTPSIHTLDHDEAFDNTSSPHRTIADMVSASTVGAGPSVQLVERMSAAVRRLESEKAATKEELARLSAQRDEARNEVVALMREVEDKRAVDERVQKLEEEMAEVDRRYQTTLDLLGEKSEECEELKADVADLKKIYRELVESTMK